MPTVCFVHLLVAHRDSAVQYYPAAWYPLVLLPMADASRPTLLFWALAWQVSVVKYTLAFWWAFLRACQTSSCPSCRIGWKGPARPEFRPRAVLEEDAQPGKHGRGVSKSRRASRVLVCGPASRSPTWGGGAHLRRCRCPRRWSPSFLVARRRVCGLDQVELVARDGREVNDVQKPGLVVPHVAKAARVSGGGLPEVPLGKKKRIWIDGNTNG